MTKIVWIASYPRSGNTWIRFLLANLLGGPYDNSARIDQLIPDLHTGITALQMRRPGTPLVKTHWVWRPDLPLREDVIGAIYLLRNPLDVIASVANYRMLKFGDGLTQLSAGDRASQAQRWIEQFIELGGDPLGIQLHMGSWDQNVESWTGKELPFPRTILRYEDLLSDTPARLRQLCRFLGLDRSEEAIATAIERSSFAAMRAMEEREIAQRQRGIFYDDTSAAAQAKGLRFVHHGVAGDGNISLSEEQRRAAIARFRPLMERFGYLAKTPIHAG